MKIAAIHQPQYLPYLGFFHKISHCDVYIVLDDVEYHRRGVQNRNKIKTATGWDWLTVPVIQSRGQLIHEVTINATAHWQRKHIGTLEVNYQPAPFYEMYMESLASILEAEHRSLCTLNMELLAWAMDALGINKPIAYSSALNVEGSDTRRLINLCKAVDAGHYFSGPGGRQYMDLEAFEQAGVAVTFQEFEAPVYEQMFLEEGFIPNLSVLDALFCCGPDTAVFVE